MSDTSAVPAIIDWLLTGATAALPNATVVDGPGAGDFATPQDVLMIGVENPFGLGNNAAELAANTQQSWAHAAGTARDERGSITCVATSWNPEGNQKAARDATFALVAEVERLLRADPRMGGLVVQAGFGETANYSQMQGDTGAAALLSFSVTFHARLRSS